MAASAAGTPEIRQRGDVTVGERRDYNLALMNTEDTAMALLSETTTKVAAAPVEESTEYTPVGSYTQEQPLQRTASEFNNFTPSITARSRSISRLHVGRDP